MTGMKRCRGHVVGLLAAFLSALSSGCSSPDDSSNGRVNIASEVIGDRRVPFTPMDDPQFGEFFTQHHRIAIAMAEHAIERGASAEVKALASKIRDRQARELQILQQAESAVSDSNTVGEMPDDPHITSDMIAMRPLSGAQLDRMFLIDMIPHQAAGLPPAHVITL